MSKFEDVFFTDKAARVKEMIKNVNFHISRQKELKGRACCTHRLDTANRNDITEEFDKKETEGPKKVTLLGDMQMAGASVKDLKGKVRADMSQITTYIDNPHAVISENDRGLVEGLKKEVDDLMNEVEQQIQGSPKESS